MRIQILLKETKKKAKYNPNKNKNTDISHSILTYLNIVHAKLLVALMSYDCPTKEYVATVEMPNIMNR